MEDTALTPEQLQRIMMHASGHKTKIILLDDVKETDSIDSLFDPTFNDAIIYSPVASAYNGHFQCMFRNNDTIYWFDSYGHTPGYLFSFVREQYGRVDNPDLYKILARSNYNIIMNAVEYQGDKAADCGRYSTSVLFLKRAANDGFDFASYYDAMTKYKDLIAAPDYDFAVTKLTEVFLK